VNIAGFTYLPDQARWSNGIIDNYEFYISPDGKNWGKAVSTGEFSNIKNNPVVQKKIFEAKEGQYIRFRALSETINRRTLGVAELGIITVDR